ncbi:MAG: NAD(P)/FAD-dependent oxidoreductase [Alistipes sp.]|nr:NAD(P)/FAD-dependent oxidoreductase [Alistipes sp.]
MYDVVIIGAGASGMMAAGRAASEGRKVLVVEKMEKAGRKVRITGKGRCNVTNTRERDEFLSHVRAGREFFARSFDRFDNRAVIRFFRDEGVKLAFERGERVFPDSGKAWDIANALYDYGAEAGAEFMFHTTATGIRTVAGKVTGVDIRTRKGYERKVDCRNVIIATGGASYPATGSTGDGYIFADRLGHRVESVRPALVPLVAGGDIARRLRGVKLKNTGVTLLVDGQAVAREHGEMEFGSRGLEGAVILRLSRMAVDALIEERQVALGLDLKTALDIPTIVARIGREVEADGELTVLGLVRKLLPAPMVPVFCDTASLQAEAPAASLTDEDRERIAALLKDLRLEVADYGPFEEAVITAGGVNTADIDPETLESRLVKGLYFAGEVLDIDADTGGYNLQVAFSTGYVAGGLGGGR